MAQVGNLFVKIGLNMNELDTGLRKLNAELKKTEREFKGFDQVGKRLQSIGKTLTAALTVPIVGMGAAAVKTSIDLEDAFAGVRKTVDGTEADFAELRKGFNDMAKEIPLAITEIYGIGEAAGQLGIKKENIIAFTDVMAKLGVATNMSSDQAATALARLANITQMPQDQFDRLGSTVVALGNNLATTESEIVEMGLRLAGAGNQVGMTEAQILSFSGALSSVGIAAEAGGSAFSRVMLNINNEVLSSGKNLELFAQIAGMSANEFSTAWKDNAAQALVAFLEGIGRMQKQGQNVVPVLDELGFSELRVRDALMRAAGAGDLFRESLELGTQAWEENTALNKEAEERFKTTASQLTLLRNNLALLADSFGQLLLPIVNGMIERFIPLIQALTEMDDGTKRVIIVIGGLVAAIGPLLLGLGSFMRMLPDIKNGLNLLKTAVSGLGSVLSWLAAHPIVVVIGALALLAKWAIDTAGGWENAKEIIINAWNVMVVGASNAALSISRAWNELKRDIYNIVNGILDAVEPLASKLPGLFKSGFENLRAGVKQKLADVEQNMSSLEASIAKNSEKISQSISTIKNTWGKTADTSAKSQAGIARDFRELEKSSQEMANTIGESAAGAGTALENFGKKAKDVASTVKDALQSALDALRLKLQITQAEFDLTKAKMGENAEQIKLLEAQYASLTEQYNIQSQIVAELQAAYDAMVAKKMEATEEGMKLYLQLLQEKTALENLREERQKATKAIEEQISSTQKLIEVTSDYIAIQYPSGAVVRYRRKSGTTIRGFSSKEEEEAFDKRMREAGGPAILFGYAEGGIIRRPVLMTDLATGRPAGIAGEAGPEAITPLGGQTVTNIRQPDVTLKVGVLVADEYGLKQLERMLAKVRIKDNMRLGVAST